MNDWDVVVVGGGPAGACAARAAVRGGARTLVLERDSLPTRRICGEYLCPGAVADLKKLGFGPAIGAARTRPLHGMRLFAPDGREVLTSFPEDQPGLSVRRYEFDPLLLEHCEAQVRRGVRVAALDVGEGGTTIRFADGEAARARVVVGADGRQSIVARQAGLRRAAPSTRATIHGYFAGVRDTSAHGEMHLPGDGTYFGLNPGADARVNVTFVSDLAHVGHDVRSHAEETLRLALDRCPSLRPRFADARLEGEVAVLAPLEVRVSEVMTDGVLLCGDAAGFLDPLTGEGLYGAVVSGRLAGTWAARAALAHRTGSAFLRHYALAHRRALGRKRRLNGLFQSILAKPGVLRFLGRRLAANRPLGDALIGVIGNLDGPGTLLRPRHLMGLVGIGR